MTVNQHPGFNPECPERFPWGILDSHALSALACCLAAKATEQLSETPDKRIEVPGIRFALNKIATIGKL